MSLHLHPGGMEPLAPPQHPDAKLLKTRNAILLRMITEEGKKNSKELILSPGTSCRGCTECLDAQLAGAAPGLCIPLLPPAWARARGCSGFSHAGGCALASSCLALVRHGHAGQCCSSHGLQLLPGCSWIPVLHSPDIYGTALSLVAVCVWFAGSLKHLLSSLVWALTSPWQGTCCCEGKNSSEKTLCSALGPFTTDLKAW